MTLSNPLPNRTFQFYYPERLKNSQTEIGTDPSHLYQAYTAQKRAQYKTLWQLNSLFNPTKEILKHTKVPSENPDSSTVIRFMST
jgi:hypothetical protein